jgi:hypothetical protein
MNDGPKISIVVLELAFCMTAIYLFKTFLDNLESETYRFNKETREMMLDLFNSTKQKESTE